MSHAAAAAGERERPATQWIRTLPWSRPGLGSAAEEDSAGMSSKSGSKFQSGGSRSRVVVGRRSSARWTSIKSQISGKWTRRSAVGLSAMGMKRWLGSGMRRRLMGRDHFSLLGCQLLLLLGRLNWRERWWV